MRIGVADATGVAALGDELFDSDVLDVKDLVEGGEGEVAASVQEVREVRLADAGLTGEQGDAEGATIDSAQQLGAHPLLQLRKVHVENSQAANGEAPEVFLRQSATGRILKNFSFPVPRASFLLWIVSQRVDVGNGSP